MRTVLGLRRCRYLAPVGMFLIVIILAGWMVGCSCGVGPTTEVRTWFDLDAVRQNLSGSYILMNDLDAGTPGYEELAGPNANGGAGWEPIGARAQLELPFTGSFDGQGYEISDLFINRPDNNYAAGLFGSVNMAGRTSVVENIGVVNITVVGMECVGGLIGYLRYGTVSNCYCAGDIAATSQVGPSDVGALVGFNYRGIVTNCYATGSVTGGDQTGGLVGLNVGGTVRDSYFIGNVAGATFVGGLVGGNTYEAEAGTVSNCHSSGIVTGNWSVGGLAGSIGSNASVTKSYSTCGVTGEWHVGGLVGGNKGSVSNCYSTGSVAGGRQVGGLVGTHERGAIDRCYSTGNVAGDRSVGGLVGANLYDGETNAVSNSFWDVETSGQVFSDGGTGKTTAEMTDNGTFTDRETEGLDEPWDMCAVASGMIDRTFTWNIVDEQTYPFLCTEQEIEHGQTEPAGLIGVQTGDWIKIEYQISGWPPDEPHPEWLKLEFLQVEGTSATVQVTMWMSDGTEQSDTVPTDLGEGGGEAFGLSGFVIPPQLMMGDSVYISGYGDVTIEGETAETYAGTSRTVVYASFSQYGVQLTYYWDKETGVMVEASSTSGDLTATAIVTETNMW